VSLSSRAIVTALLAVLLAGAAWLGLEVLVVIAAGLVLLFAAGWAAVSGQPRESGTGIVVATAGLLALLAAWHASSDSVLRFLPQVLGITVGLAFLAEMLRQDGRPGLVSSLSAAMTGAIIGVGLAGWVAATRFAGEQTQPGFGLGDGSWLGTGPYRPALVVVGALCLVMAATIFGLRVKPGWIGFLLTMWLVALVGALLGLAFPQVGWNVGLIVGALVGLIASVLRMIFGDDVRLGETRAALSAAVAPIAASGLLMFALRWLSAG
jgi:hypothetical protein